MGGFVYIMSNPSHQDGMLKIGKSSKDPEEFRKRELETSGVPAPFFVEYSAFVEDHNAVERNVHHALDKNRYRREREFFILPLTDAIKAIRDIAGNTMRFEQLSGNAKQRLSGGSTLALSEEVIDCLDVVKRDGIYYKKFAEVPFTGKTTGYIQGTFRNGKKHGPWVSYHVNGQLSEKGNYKNGKEEGPWVHCWEDGQLWAKGTYKNGRREGPWVELWEDGQLWEKGTSKNGNKEGPWVHYNRDGTVNEEYTGTFKNGKKVD